MELKRDGLIYEVRNLCVEGRLDNVSFEVSPGEKLVLLGVNGAGKSTLLKVLAGLYKDYRGELKFMGLPLKSILSDKSLRKEFRKNVAIMLQEVSAMFFNPTVYDELAFSLRQLGYSNSQIKERVHQVAEQLGIADILNREPYNLSGGERKKVAFGCCIIHEPKVLILDEPTANLDPEGVAVLIDIISQINATIITATHNVSLSSELGDRFLILSKDHRLLYDGKYSEELKETLKLAGFLHKHKGKPLHIHDWD